MRFAFSFFFFLGFLLYFGSLKYGFFLDDQFQIVTNRFVQDLSLWSQHFIHSTVDLGVQGMGGIYYKPVMMTFYSFLWQLTPGEAFSFRVFQLLVHCLNSFLVFCFFKNVFSKENSLYAFLVGLLFLCHPMNSEAVLFIADLQEPLYTLFGLLALVIFIGARQKINVFVAAFFIFLSLLSKESGLLYLLILGVYAFLFKRDYFKTLVTAFVFVIGGYLTLRLGFAGLHAVHSDTMQISRADFLTRLMTMPKVLIHYIHLFFWPQSISLTQDWIVRSFSFKDFWLPFVEVICVVAASLFYVNRKKESWFLFFFIWFLLGWGLHSQLVPLDGTVSDRWFYFTMLGFLGMIFTFLANEVRLGFNQILMLGFLIVSVLSIRTYFRTLDWKDGLTLYSHDLQIDPDSFYLNNNVGLEYLNREQYAKAVPYFEKTMQLSVMNSSAWVSALTNLAAVHLFTNQPDQAEALLAKALASGDLKVYRAYAGALWDGGKKAEFIEFMQKTALVRYPNDTVLLRLMKNFGL